MIIVIEHHISITTNTKNRAICSFVPPMEAKKSNRVREILKLQYILKKWEKVANASKQANNNNNSNEEEKQASEEDNPPQM